jgi:hypothetical protein
MGSTCLPLLYVSRPAVTGVSSVTRLGPAFALSHDGWHHALGDHALKPGIKELKGVVKAELGTYRLFDLVDRGLGIDCEATVTR